MLTVLALKTLRFSGSRLTVYEEHVMSIKY
jgi:hypothetical protein